MKRIVTLILCLFSYSILSAGSVAYSIYAVSGKVYIQLPDGSKETAAKGMDITFNTVLEIAEGSTVQVLDSKRGLVYRNAETGTMKVGTLILGARKQSQNEALLLVKQLRSDLKGQSAERPDRIMGVSFRGDPQDMSYAKEAAGAILYSLGKKDFSRKLELKTVSGRPVIANNTGAWLFVNVLCITEEGPSICLDFTEDGLLLPPGSSIQLPLNLSTNGKFIPFGTDQPLDTRVLQRYLDEKETGEKSNHVLVGKRL